MSRNARRYGLTTKSFAFALAVHVFIAVLVGVSFQWSEDPQTLTIAPPAEAEPVMATVISSEDVEREVAQLKAQDERKEQEMRERELKLEELEQAAAELDRKRVQKEQQLAALEEKQQADEREAREAEQKRIEQEKKAAAEKERLAKIEKEKEAKRQAELKKKQEAERKRKERELAEQRRKEQERQAEAARAQLERQAVSAFSQYRAAIQQKVSRNWIRPATFRNGLSADVLVKISPSGDVVETRIVRSSGDPVFDRSVVNAVLKASPLPIPSDRKFYDFIREFKLAFEPDGKLVS